MSVSFMLRRVLVSAVCLSLAASCTHVLTISNLPDTRTHGATPARMVTVGVVNIGSRETEYYVEAIAASLELAASVERVVYPYVKTAAAVDVVANVSVDPEYRGAWTNFLVNWPGYLLFAPAWNGYKYRANPRTRVQLMTPEVERIETISWEYEYVFHQADMDRTWTGIGWLEFGVIPLIGGVVFIRYDSNQTLPFMRAVRYNYGNQVASQISQRLSDFPPLNIPHPR